MNRTTRRPPTQKELDAAVAEFNTNFPVGTPVKFWKGGRDRPPEYSIVNRPAFVLSGHSAVAGVAATRVCIATTHIEKDDR